MTGFHCDWCRGYKNKKTGERTHTHKCPIYVAALIAGHSDLLRWDERSLLHVTERKERNALIAAIERRAKLLCRLTGKDYNRINRDRERSEEMLKKLLDISQP